MRADRPLEELQAPAQARPAAARMQARRLPQKASRRVAARARAQAQRPPRVRPSRLLRCLLQTSAPPEPQPPEPRQGAARQPEGDAAAPPRGAQGTAAESTLRVDVTLLNRMMNLVGELVLTRNQVLQATAADPNMTLLSRRLDMVTADLRESVMKARMQPVSNIFSKMPRIVRDLSQSLGRRVRLQVEGQETELDKSLLEAIKDPLTHAVRNSLDHGIEPPEVREAAGKDPEGTLKLRAAQEGSHVVIEVSDDGAGIAVEKVRQKAIERGLITPSAPRSWASANCCN
jgi:two-component system, chemotaxis family, sensor kinase CheA